MSGLDKIVAQNVEYDNTVSGMTADEVQEAIDELKLASGNYLSTVSVDTTLTGDGTVESPLSVVSAGFADTDLGNLSVTGQAIIDGKVNKTGDETIDGIKTFSSFPITPSSAPTTDYQVANKKYVDGKGIPGIPDYSAGVSKTGTWVAEYSGVYKIRFGGNIGGNAGSFTVDGQTFYGQTYNSEEKQTISAVVGKGSTVVLTSANTESIFYPFL